MRLTLPNGQGHSSTNTFWHFHLKRLGFKFFSVSPTIIELSTKKKLKTFKKNKEKKIGTLLKCPRSLSMLAFAGRIYIIYIYI